MKAGASLMLVCLDLAPVIARVEMTAASHHSIFTAQRNFLIGTNRPLFMVCQVACAAICR